MEVISSCYREIAICKDDLFHFAELLNFLPAAKVTDPFVCPILLNIMRLSQIPR